MNIFREVKERVTARQVAERYGLKVRRNGMACCPFHNDKHPSMKIDRNYYCFACGAKFQSRKQRQEENKIQVSGKKRRFQQKRNGFNLFKRKLTDGQRML